MSDQRQAGGPSEHSENQAAATRGGWLSSRRGLLKTASGLAAAGVIGAGLTEAGGARASETPPVRDSGNGSQGGAIVFQTAPNTASAAEASARFWMKIHGDKQQDFPGGTVKGHEGQIAGFTFEFGLAGDPSKKPTFDPITVGKRFDKASAHILQALVNHENLRVDIQFLSQPDPNQGESVEYTIKLSQATIVSVKQHVPVTGDIGVERLEAVSFAFQKIEVKSFGDLFDGGVAKSEPSAFNVDAGDHRQA